MSQKLFDYPDTTWVPEARKFLEIRLPEHDFKEHAVKSAVSIINMMKTFYDAERGLNCVQGVLGILTDVLRLLHHNPFWIRLSSEITARVANGLSRYGEATGAMQKGFKPNGTIDDAEFIASQMAWLDAVVFIYETLDPNGDAFAFRTDLRKLLHGV